MREEILCGIGLVDLLDKLQKIGLVEGFTLMSSSVHVGGTGIWSV